MRGMDTSTSTKIQFLAVDERYGKCFDPPVPASSLLPQWYKEQDLWVNGEKQIMENGKYPATVKNCMPVLDCVTAGYVLSLPSDLHVTQNTPDSLSTVWPVDYQLIESHSPEQISSFAVDDIWNPAVLKLVNRWVIKTPPGYSTMFLSPMWRTDYRFQAFCGIVDTDTFPRPVNFPFVVRKDFVGTIENNTPFVQLIPFKRDEWETEIGVVSEEDENLWTRATRSSAHVYKNNFRTLKRWD